MSTEEARDRFASAHVARLATADRSGRPHLVPIVFAVEGDRIYSAVDAKPKRTTTLRRLANIRENPRVSLLVDHYEEDWSKLWWARADGQGAVFEPDEPKGVRAIELLSRRYPQFEAQGEVVEVEVERWSGWSAS